MTASVERPAHHRLAEEGKQLALRGAHEDALERYREAMRLAQAAGVPAVVVRHYAWCAMESLERAGHFDGVIAFCDQVEAIYKARPPETPAGVKDLAAHLERKGVALWKRGDATPALAALREALRLDPSLAVSAQLSRWIASRLTVTPERLAAELDRHRYWTVRPDNLSPATRGS